MKRIVKKYQFGTDGLIVGALGRFGADVGLVEVTINCRSNSVNLGHVLRLNISSPNEVEFLSRSGGKNSTTVPRLYYLPIDSERVHLFFDYKRLDIGAVSASIDAHINVANSEHSDFEREIDDADERLGDAILLLPKLSVSSAGVELQPQGELSQGSFDQTGQAWWAEPSAGVVTPEDQRSDNSPVTFGQLKNFATMAMRHLDRYFVSAGGAGGDIHAAVAAFSNRYNYHAVNNAQLHEIARLFHARLTALGFTNLPSLTASPEDSFKIATIGRVKALFSFNLNGFHPDLPDADNDGQSDFWEAFYSVDDPFGDADGDGVSNFLEYLHGLNPNDGTSLLSDIAFDGIADDPGTGNLKIVLPSGAKFEVIEDSQSSRLIESNN